MELREHQRRPVRDARRLGPHGLLLRQGRVRQGRHQRTTGHLGRVLRRREEDPRHRLLHHLRLRRRWPVQRDDVGYGRPRLQTQRRQTDHQYHQGQRRPAVHGPLAEDARRRPHRRPHEELDRRLDEVTGWRLHRQSHQRRMDGPTSCRACPKPPANSA